MNSNLVQHIAQQKDNFNKHMNSQSDAQPIDIIKEMDDHLKNLHESDEELMDSYQVDSLSAQKLYKFIEIWLKLKAWSTTQTVTKKCYYFYLWNTKIKLSYNNDAPLEYIDQKWETETHKLRQQQRYPIQSMSKNRRELEIELFDIERKHFYQDRTTTILKNVFRNLIKKQRLLKVIAFHRWARNASRIQQYGSTQSNSIISMHNSGYHIKKPDNKPSNVNVKPSSTTQQYHNNNQSRSKSPINRVPISSNSRVVHHQQPVQPTNNKTKKMNGAFKVLIILMKRDLNDYQKVTVAMMKWIKFNYFMRNIEQVEELKQINFILNERVFRENLFRTKIMLAKSELESKLQLTQELLLNMIQAQK